MMLLTTFGVVVVYMVVLWAISIPLGDPSFIDSGWGFGFVVIAFTAFLIGHGDPTRRVIMLAACGVWGLRLAGYLAWRWRRDGPDRRYQSMLRNAGFTDIALKPSDMPMLTSVIIAKPSRAVDTNIVNQT